MEEYRNCVQKTKEHIQSKLESDERFSLSLDESTSIQVRRYLSTILHTRDDIINLGLTRIATIVFLKE